MEMEPVESVIEELTVMEAIADNVKLPPPGVPAPPGSSVMAAETVMFPVWLTTFPFTSIAEPSVVMVTLDPFKRAWLI